MIKLFRHIQKSLLMENQKLVIPTEQSDEESQNRLLDCARNCKGYLIRGQN